jgi:hypothetical protein
MRRGMERSNGKMVTASLRKRGKERGRDSGRERGKATHYN